MSHYRDEVSSVDRRAPARPKSLGEVNLARGYRPRTGVPTTADGDDETRQSSWPSRRRWLVPRLGLKLSTVRVALDGPGEVIRVIETAEVRGPSRVQLTQVSVRRPETPASETTFDDQVCRPRGLTRTRL